MQADNITYIYGDITKFDPEGNFEGFISSGAVDVTGQIVDQEWLKKELPPWVRDWSNIRHQHDPSRPIGKATEVDLTTSPGPYLKGRVIEAEAKRNGAAGLYKGLSIGVKGPIIVKDAEAPNGRIVGGRLIEISLVDRPANDDAKLMLFKAVGDHAWKDLQTGATIEIDQPAAATPDAIKCSLAGCDCTCKPGEPDEGCDCQCTECVTIREDATKVGSPDFYAFTEAGVYKRAFTDAQRKKFGGTGVAMKDGSYPIESTGDLSNAISAFGRSKNPDATKRHIIKRAKALGATNLLPADWSGSTKEEKTVTAATVPTDSTQPVDSDVKKARVPKSEPNHAHPMTGKHNHAHDDQKGGLHTHAHQHDDDDMHDHPHLAGKDARMLSPEDRSQAMALYAADSGAAPAKADAEKGAPDFNLTRPNPDTLLDAAGKKVIPAQVSTPMDDAVARLEALASETDDDRDGDVDLPEDQTPQKKASPASFREASPDPQTTLPNPPKLNLRFAADPDLVKALDALISARVDERVLARERAESTKAAETMTTVADVSAMSSDLAKGLGLVATRLEADVKKMAEYDTRLSALDAELVKVRDMAMPIKGDAVVVEKQFLGNGSNGASGPTLPEALRALAKKHNLSDQEQMELAAASYNRLTGQT